MSDLLERLKEALSERERIALAALGEEWELDRPSRVITAVGDGDAFRAHGYKVEFAEHAAHNHPKAVLRQVAAHRKILELHPLANGEDSEMCETCRYVQDPDDDEPFDEAGYPCPTVLAVAEGYDITEEPVTG